MTDLIYIIVSIAFFAFGCWYTIGCDRL